MSETKVSAFRWAQFVVGTVLFGAMLYAHLYVKELPLLLMAIPGLLMGVDFSKLLKAGDK